MKEKRKLTEGRMKKFLITLILTTACAAGLFAGNRAAGTEKGGIDEYIPTRAFYVSFPDARNADEFIKFVKEDMIPGGFNMLVVRVDWRFNWKAHPELIAEGAWSMEKIKELVGVCREGNMALVPMINLLGHQSWQDRMAKLLEVYPQFDEKPYVKLSDYTEWKWPNRDKYYCKSYCPNHPELHPILFSCIDELLDAFETDMFHGGMDEVFDLADAYCPRCQGMDPARVFADEVNRINAHLKERGARLMIWADRLLDGRDEATGYGEWSASMTNTHRAIGMIDRSVIMCDWHYRVAEQSAVLFALNGYEVITGGWMHPAITTRQIEDIIRYRVHSSEKSAKRYLGFMQTVWSGWEQFIRDYRENSDEDSAARNYREAKKLFAKYAKEYRGKGLPEKDGRRIRGL